MLKKLELIDRKRIPIPQLKQVQKQHCSTANSNSVATTAKTIATSVLTTATVAANTTKVASVSKATTAATTTTPAKKATGTK